MPRANYDIEWWEIGDEEWRPIAVAPGYEVSALGQVRNARTRGVLAPARARGARYLYVRLAGPDRRQRTQYIHRLVCAAFHGEKPGPDYSVDHLDGRTENNRATNLEWVTRRENSLRYHARAQANAPTTRGLDLSTDWELDRLYRENFPALYRSGAIR